MRGNEVQCKHDAAQCWWSCVMLDKVMWRHDKEIIVRWILKMKYEGGIFFFFHFSVYRGFYSKITQDKNGSTADWLQIRNKETDKSSWINLWTISKTKEKSVKQVLDRRAYHSNVKPLDTMCDVVTDLSSLGQCLVTWQNTWLTLAHCHTVKVFHSKKIGCGTIFLHYY